MGKEWGKVLQGCKTVSHTVLPIPNNKHAIVFFSLHLLRKERSVRELSGHLSQLHSHSLDAPPCADTGCVPVAHALMDAVVSPRSPARCACTSVARKDKNSPATSCGSFSAAALRAAVWDHQHSTRSPSAYPMTYIHLNIRLICINTHSLQTPLHVTKCFCVTKCIFISYTKDPDL